MTMPHRALRIPLSPPVTSAVAIGLIGLIGVWAGLPVLLASLGPTIAIQSKTPQLPSARPWNVLVGHYVGIATGFLAVYATGAFAVPAAVNTDPLSLLRMAAAALAMVLGLGLESLLNAYHPPSAATTLLIALGIMTPNWHTVITIVCGVALVAVFGEAVRRARLRLTAPPDLDRHHAASKPVPP